LALSLGGANLLFAQSKSLAAVPAGASDDNWTVLTMAPDGAWGVATDAAVNQAIARALSSCKTRSRTEIGCGAYSTAIRSGWSLGIRCGRNNIVVSANELADAERTAGERERVLRQNYVPDMPPCRRVGYGSDRAKRRPAIHHGQSRSRRADLEDGHARHLS